MDILFYDTIITQRKQSLFLQNGKQNQQDFDEFFGTFAIIQILLAKTNIVMIFYL